MRLYFTGTDETVTRQGNTHNYFTNSTSMSTNVQKKAQHKRTRGGSPIPRKQSAGAAAFQEVFSKTIAQEKKDAIEDQVMNAKAPFTVTTLNGRQHRCTKSEAEYIRISGAVEDNKLHTHRSFKRMEMEEKYPSLLELDLPKCREARDSARATITPESGVADESTPFITLV